MAERVSSFLDHRLQLVVAPLQEPLVVVSAAVAKDSLLDLKIAAPP